MATHQVRQKARKLGGPRRGDIYLVNFDPTLGAEIKKTRPALVIRASAETMNRVDQAIQISLGLIGL